MGNPWAGEVAITVDGVPRVMRLTLGALAELEAGLGEASIIALIERFEAGRFSGRDVLALIVAGLRGGGWRDCAAADLAVAEIEGGPVGAARAAAELLARSFAVPGE
jgi:hypothetical protein